MAIYRKVNINFWSDEKIIDDFTPEDRYFMLYLMTNPQTNQIGCYHITIKQMEFETGYNKETIIKLIARFEKILKVIKYSEETKEILILNWHKYNWSNSPKVLACINKEFKTIKNKEFRYCIDTLFKQYEYSIHTETQEEEKEKEEEKENICEQIQQVYEMYNKICVNLPTASKLNEDRKKKIKERLKHITISDFKKIFTISNKSDFLTGKTSNWKANLDWLIKNDKNYLKVLEGNYNNKEEKINWRERGLF